jgi:hypothetical protein
MHKQDIVIFGAGRVDSLLALASLKLSSSLKTTLVHEKIEQNKYKC